MDTENYNLFTEYKDLNFEPKLYDYIFIFPSLISMTL